MMRLAVISVALFAGISPAQAEQIRCVLTDVGGGPTEDLEIVMPADRTGKDWKQLVTFKGDAEGSFTKLSNPQIRIAWPQRLDITWKQVNDTVDGPKTERNAIRVHHIQLDSEETGIASIKAGHPAMVLTNRNLLGRDGQVHGPGWYIEGQCVISPNKAAGA